MDNRYTDTPLPNKRKFDKPIPEVYGAIDNDLARDNLEHDLPFSDREDLRHSTPGSDGEDF